MAEVTPEKLTAARCYEQRRLTGEQTWDELPADVREGYEHGFEDAMCAPSAERDALRQRAEAAEAEADALRGALEAIEAVNGSLGQRIAGEGRKVLRITRTAHAEIAAARREVCQAAAAGRVASRAWVAHLDRCAVCNGWETRRVGERCAAGDGLYVADVCAVSEESAAVDALAALEK